MSDPMTEPRASSVVKCEKHGLHYDASRMSGCVICRREAGGGGAMARPSSAAAASRGSLGQALAVTAILLALTTAALFFTHGFVVETFQGADRDEARTLDEDFDRQMEEMGLPPEGEAGDGAEED